MTFYYQIPSIPCDDVVEYPFGIHSFNRNHYSPFEYNPWSNIEREIAKRQYEQELLSRQQAHQEYEQEILRRQLAQRQYEQELLRRQQEVARQKYQKGLRKRHSGEKEYRKQTGRFTPGENFHHLNYGYPVHNESLNSGHGEYSLSYPPQNNSTRRTITTAQPLQSSSFVPFSKPLSHFLLPMQRSREDYINELRETLAARKIQSAFRSYSVRRKNKAAYLITKSLRNYIFIKRTKSLCNKLRLLNTILLEAQSYRDMCENKALTCPLNFVDGKLKPDKDSKPFLEYEDFLLKLLLKLDEIQSNGSQLLRERRKDVVEFIQNLLGKLDLYKKNCMLKTVSGHNDAENTDIDMVDELEPVGITYVTPPA